MDQLRSTESLKSLSQFSDFHSFSDGVPGMSEKIRADYFRLVKKLVRMSLLFFQKRSTESRFTLKTGHSSIRYLPKKVVELRLREFQV